MTVEETPQDFARAYYDAAENHRSELAALYQDDGHLDFDGQKSEGTVAIANQFTSGAVLPVHHRIVSTDFVPYLGTGYLVLFTGHLQIGGVDRTRFSRIWRLAATGSTYKIAVDIFRSGVTIPAMKEQIPPNGLNPVAAPTDSAQAFIEGFYDTSETSPGELRGCYADSAMMSFNGDTFTGKDAIMQKFAGLPMTQIKHHLYAVDDVASTDNGTLVFVEGLYTVDGLSTLPTPFIRVFHVTPAGASSFLITNDIFRDLAG